MPQQPLFSVIIPTCDRAHALKECLRRLAPGAQAFPEAGYEVIVSDDGSDCDAKEVCESSFPWTRWTAGPRRGPAANRNNGARFARGEWLAFTDDDCFPDPLWLSSLRAAAQSGAMALEGAIHPVGEIARDMAHCPVNLEGGRFWTANVALKRSLFQEIGGFDENFARYNEDQDIELRIKQRTQIEFLPAAKVFHPVVIVPLGRALQQIPTVARDWAYYTYKNRKRLGCRNPVMRELGNGTYFWLHNSVRSLLGGRIRSLIKALAMLTVGQALVTFELLRLARRTGHADS